MLTFLQAFWDNFKRLIMPLQGKSLRNEVAVVTGAGHGIGRQLALQLAREGVKVVCWDINAKTVEETAQEIRRRHGISYAFQCDVGNQEDVKRVAQETRYYHFFGGQKSNLMKLFLCAPHTAVGGKQCHQSCI